MVNEAFSAELNRLQSARSAAAILPESFAIVGDTWLWLERDRGRKFLAVLRPADSVAEPFEGQRAGDVLDRPLLLCALSDRNAATLRQELPNLHPTLLGLRTSAGFGDRLGIATPGHVRALRRVAHEGGVHEIAPIFAQQSIREMERTGRSPLDVLNDATWGAFGAGWREPLGADADHLKTHEDIDRTAACGYSFYTIDPGEFVDGDAANASPDVVRRAWESLPWERLETDPADLERRYTRAPIELDDRPLVIDREALVRAAVKYGRAIAHVGGMYRHLATRGISFELEVSVDETRTPTTHGEHAYIAGELRRLGVEWVSLAPRFVGTFEKGVDYIGDVDTLRADLDGHAAIARSLGPYKLSLHSGSDKFLVYPLLQEATRGLLHLKTAGTSYLEALRVTARVDPALFRAVTSFAAEQYARDRATYHVSADPARLPPLRSLPDVSLADLLDDFDARQTLHVTFGSVLARYGPQLMRLLLAHEETYAGTLEAHFVPHLAPFAGSTYSAADGSP